MGCVSSFRFQMTLASLNNAIYLCLLSQCVHVCLVGRWVAATAGLGCQRTARGSQASPSTTGSPGSNPHRHIWFKSLCLLTHPAQAKDMAPDPKLVDTAQHNLFGF